MLEFWSRRLPVICATIIAVMVANLFYLGAQPIAVGLFPVPWDKLANAITFGTLTALWCGVFRARRPWLVLLIVAAIAAADEIHQIWLPGRSADVADFLADMAASGLVLAALRIHANFRVIRPL